MRATAAAGATVVAATAAGTAAASEVLGVGYRLSNWSWTNAASASREGCPQPMQKG